MKKDTKLLNNKERVSIPEIQAYMECDYTAAKKQLQEYIVNGMVSEAPEGIYYLVNTLAINPKTLSSDELDLIGTLISGDEINLLGYLKKNDKIKLSECPEIEASPQDYTCLLSRGIIHRFGEWYYLSITKESTEKLLENPPEEVDDEIIVHVARPIVTYCLENSKDPSVMLSNGFMPEACIGYVERGYSHFSRLGKKPDYTKKPPKLKNKNIIKFELMEAFIGRYDYDNKQAYENEAHRQLSAVEAEDAFPEVFKEAARDAVSDICDELTFSNIREIRKIIKSSST